MIIQIYEIQTADEARAMIDLGVDHIGSVLLSAEQLRNTALREAIAVMQAAGRRSSLIPLFSDIDSIAEAVEYYRPDILHFCEALAVADPNAEEVLAAVECQKTIRRRFRRLALMRSIPIGESGSAHKVPSLQLATAFAPYSDWFLTDTLLFERPAGGQPVSGYVGITGRTCDWETARRLVSASSIPVILAGGIGPHNVAEGIAKVNPAGIDSCTLTNAVDGEGRVIRFRKDHAKVQELIKAVHQIKMNN